MPSLSHKQRKVINGIRIGQSLDAIIEKEKLNKIHISRWIESNPKFRAALENAQNTYKLLLNLDQSQIIHFARKHHQKLLESGCEDRKLLEYYAQRGQLLETSDLTHKEPTKERLPIHPDVSREEAQSLLNELLPDK